MSTSSSESVRRLRIPDLFASCPLTPSTNPNYKEAAAESRAWINSYSVFADRKRAEFIQGQNELFALMLTLSRATNNSGRLATLLVF